MPHYILPEGLDDFDRRHQEALILGFEGDSESSISALQSLIAEQPEHIRLRFDLAMALIALSQFDEACVQLRRVLEIEPNHAIALEMSSYC